MVVMMAPGSTQSLSDDRGGAHIACSRSARSSTTRRSSHNCKRPIIRLPSTIPLWLQPSENLSLIMTVHLIEFESCRQLGGCNGN